jgi:hypothetical protein
MTLGDLFIFFGLLWVGYALLSINNNLVYFIKQYIDVELRKHK